MGDSIQVGNPLGNENNYGLKDKNGIQLSPGVNEHVHFSARVGTNLCACSDDPTSTGDYLPSIATALKYINKMVAPQLPSLTPPVLPPSITLSVDNSYCELIPSSRPAVRLSWTVSDVVASYRVFRNDIVIGMNLNASQLSSIDNFNLVPGQTYRYKVQANGATWSNTAQVIIPADVCAPNFISPSPGTNTVSTGGYQPTITVSGNVTQVSFSWSGANNGSVPAPWVKGDANWLSKVTSNPDGTLTLRPVVTQTGDAPGITNWTVTIRDSTGTTRTQSFSVNYQPTAANIYFYSMTPATSSINENAGTVTFTITRSGGLPAETVFVSTTTTEGFANNTDYTGIPNQFVTFAANQTSATVTVTLTNDSVVEPNETFGLIMQRNTSDAVTTFLAKATFTIVNDD